MKVKSVRLRRKRVIFGAEQQVPQRRLADEFGEFGEFFSQRELQEAAICTIVEGSSS